MDIADPARTEDDRAPDDEPRPDRPARRVEPAGLFALVLVSLIWTWWALKHGAYFGAVLLPGAILLCLGTAVLLGTARRGAGPRLSRPAAIALAALVGLGVWELLSALWSPAPEVAVADGQRVLIYALIFALGLGLCRLLGPRPELAMVPLAVAGAVVATVTIVALVGNDVPADLLLKDGTLEFPLGYRNANAAFFGIAFFAALGLATERTVDWRIRAIGLGTATACLNLALVCESRAWAAATVAGLVVYLLVSPLRVRALSWLLLAAIPAVAILPDVSSLFEAAKDDGIKTVTVGLVNAAGRTAALTTLAALVLGAVAARFEARLPGLGSTRARANRIVAWGLAVLAAATATAFVAAVGNPADWISQRADEVRSGGDPNLSGNSTRFALSASSDRYDLWRVALEDAKADPLLGDGGGGYQYSYLRERRVAYQNVHDAHSVQLETLAEFGIPGLVLLLAAFGGAAVGLARSRRLGPPAAGLTAVAAGAGTYWLVHASVDWMWPYPAITAPVIALFGSACAPAIGARARISAWPWRPVAVGALAVLALSVVPPFLSERYVNRAYAGWRTDLEGAYEDLDRARDLNRLSVFPLLAKGSIARAAGDRERAVALFREAIAKRPEEWVAHYLLAALEASRNPELARREIRIALELNPLEGKIISFADRLGLDSSGEPQKGTEGQR